QDPDDNFHLAALEVTALDAVDPGLPRFILRGEIDSRSTLIPVPGGASAFHRFSVQALQRNSFGAFHLTPADPVVNTAILWHPRFFTERPPWTSTITRRIDNTPVPVQI